MTFGQESSGKPDEARYYQTGDGALQDSKRKGFPSGSFFPHRVYRLQRGGPDGLRAARLLGLDCSPEQLWQILLYALPPALAGLPRELFLDDTIQWHRQHFGRVGHLAWASLALIDDKQLFVTRCTSDLMERAPRGHAHYDEVQRRFRGWGAMLASSVLSFARELGVAEVFFPTTALLQQRTASLGQLTTLEDWNHRQDEARKIPFDGGEAEGWWRLPVKKNAKRVLALERGVERFSTPDRTVCLFHDIERGLGHVDSDPTLAEAAESTADATLAEMLQHERERGVRATYLVVGQLLSEIRATIQADGHALGFHSYDHDLATPQLPRCREVDARLKGYRSPQSKLTDELSDEALIASNFEWLLGGPRALGTRVVRVDRGLVKLPTLWDDYRLYSKKQSFSSWEAELYGKMEAHSFVALGLHDCYGRYWLPHYRDFLERLGASGTFRTLDEVAADATLSSATWSAETPEANGIRLKRRRPKRAMFCAVATLLALVLCELLLQLVCLVSPPAAAVLSDDFGVVPRHVDDPVLHHRLNPALRDYDSTGFRNAARPSSVQIVAIGDSQTYGTCVARANAWPQRLQARTGLSTYNMGVGGYGTAHYLALVDDALAMTPECIVVGVYLGNDLKEAVWLVYDSPAHHELRDPDPRKREHIRVRAGEGSAWARLNRRVSSIKRRWFDDRNHRVLRKTIESKCRLYGLSRSAWRLLFPVDRPPRGDRHPVNDTMVKDVVAAVEPTIAWRFEHDGISTVLTPELIQTSLDLRNPRIQEGLRLSLEALQRIQEKTRDKAALLVVLIPTKELVFSDLLEQSGQSPPPGLLEGLRSEREVRARLTQFLDALGIEWLDALPALRAHLDRGENPYFNDWETHPNRAATNSIATLIIEKHLAPRGLVPGAQDSSATTE